MSSGQKGTLDVLDLLFTPFPQFLPELGIESVLVGERDTCPSSKILKRGVHYHRTKLGAWSLYLAIQLSGSRGGSCV